MSKYRAFIKNIFYRVGLVNVLDFLLFRASQWRNWKKNSFFRKTHPDLVIPPDYFLYETYLLDYEQYFSDGEQTAKEIIEWTKKYIPKKEIRILDFGCGISRVIAHVKKFAGTKALLYGCDINKKMIRFNQNHFKDIAYLTSPFTPPTAYEKGFFDLVYALSIFTHIRDSLQQNWIKEIHRILKEDGIFLFTTHGQYFYSRLLKSEKKILEKEGVFTKEFKKEGHRMMSTYNSEASVIKLLKPYFEILEFHDGAIDQTKTGGQDLWIVKKTKNSC